MINFKGFTLVEILVAVAIIAILSVIGLTVFSQTQKNARDSKKIQDIKAIGSAYEIHYDGLTSSYAPLAINQFVNGTLPLSTNGISYNFISGPNAATPQGLACGAVKICAPLEGGAPNCSDSSVDCFCYIGLQGDRACLASIPPPAPPGPPPAPPGPPGPPAPPPPGPPAPPPPGPPAPPIAYNCALLVGGLISTNDDLVINSGGGACSNMGIEINGDCNISGDISVGGAGNQFSCNGSGSIGGTVAASTVDVNGSMTIQQDAYYQTIDPGITVLGTRYPGSNPPVFSGYPISEAKIDSWKTQTSVATALLPLMPAVTSCPGSSLPSGTYPSLNFTSPCNIVFTGPVRVTGNFNMKSSTNVTTNFPLYIGGNVDINGDSTFTVGTLTYIAGNVDLNSGTNIQINPSAATSGVFLVENKIDINGDTSVVGSSGKTVLLVARGGFNLNGDLDGIAYSNTGPIDVNGNITTGTLVGSSIDVNGKLIINYIPISTFSFP